MGALWAPLVGLERTELFVCRVKSALTDLHELVASDTIAYTNVRKRRRGSYTPLRWVSAPDTVKDLLKDFAYCHRRLVASLSSSPYHRLAVLSITNLLR
jgi:hypothetical protein